MPTETFKKGDDVWFVHIQRWNKIFDTPSIYHGKVTGGGEFQLRITWDHHQMEPERIYRTAAERQYDHTRAQAIQTAVNKLEEIRAKALKDEQDAAGALFYLREVANRTA